MSFGLSSGGGQVRYALIVDDQATAKLNTFKNSLTTLGTGTTQLSSKMSIMNNAFSAGVTPIKNQGNALNQLATTQKTIVSQLGGLGTAFKSNALAIGAAASSVLGLYQNYANLSSAQNAANKSATAAKAAQNSVTTAVKNLNKAIDQYGQGSKQAKDAQDKLTVAQERLVNKTESAKIAQDNLNQTMADFGINILPNVLLAGGSVTSIFDNIGSKGKGLGGIISKLSGAFGGLGGATGLLKGGMAGLLTTLGPLALALGGIAAALLYAKDTAEVAAKAMEEFKAAAKLEDVTKSIQGMNAALDKLKLTPGIGSLKQIGDLIASLGAGGLRNNFVDMAKNMASGARLAASDIGKLAEAQKKLDADSAALASKQKERQTTAVKNEVKHMEAVVADDKAEVARLKTLVESNALKSKSIALTQEELNIISRRNEAMATAREQDIKVAEALGEVITKTKTAADDAKRQAEAVAQLDTALNKTLPNMIKFGEASAASAESTKLVGDMVKLTKDRMIEWNPAAGASADIMSTIDGVLAGLPAKQASWTNSINASAEAEKKAADALKKFQDLAAKGIADLSLGLKVKDNGDKLVKEILDNIKGKAKKKIKLDLQFSADQKVAQEKFSQIIAGAATLSDSDADAIVKGIIKTIDEKFGGKTGPFGNLRKKLEDSLDSPNTPDILKNNITSGDYTPAGEKINKDVQAGINKTPLTVEVKASLAGFLQGGKSRFSNTVGGNKILEALGFKPEDLKITIPAPTIPAPVTTAFDTGVATAKTKIADISKTVPILNLSNTEAFKRIDATAKKILSLTKLVPIINLSNTEAFKRIDATAKKILSLSKPQPSINVSNTEAFKRVDAVAKKIMSLENLNPTVTVHVKTVGGAISAQKGLHAYLLEDTTIMAHKGERVDIGHGSEGKGGGVTFNTGGGGTGGGGPTIIENHIHIGDENLLRKFTARSGKNRFTMGM